MKAATTMEKAKVWISENLGTKIATRLFRGLALGVLLVAATGIYFSINQGEAGSTLASEQGACYPELGPCPSEFIAVAPTIVDRYDRALFDEIPTAAVEYWPEVGLDSHTYHRFMVNQGKAGSPLSSEQFEYWPEVGLDSHTYHRFMVEQGKVGRVDSGKVYAEIEDVEAMVIYGYSASIFHALNQGKVASPRVSKQTECYPELDIC